MFHLDQADTPYFNKYSYQLYPLRTVNFHHQSLNGKPPALETRRCTGLSGNQQYISLIDHSFINRLQ